MVDARFDIARAAGVLAALRRQHGRQGLLDRDLVHRRIDMQPPPGAGALLQRGGGGRGHHIGHDHVTIRHRAGDDRITIGPAGQEGAARQRAAGPIDPPFLRERAGLAEDAARDHDQPRIARRERRIAEPELVHRAG